VASETALLPWQRAIADAIVEAGVEAVAWVPDARLRGIVDALDGTVIHTLTREEECVGFAGIGMPLVISMRGTLGESNPAQVPMGRATRALLEALTIQSLPLTDPDAAAAAS
jgi:sulfopyruvate decarboxylase subunit alpha